MELFTEIDKISLSCLVLKNQTVMESTVQKRMTKNNGVDRYATKDGDLEIKEMTIVCRKFPPLQTRQDLLSKHETVHRCFFWHAPII